MKKILLLCFVATTLTASIALQAADQPVKLDDTDITSAFFVALATCIPGEYQEKNVLSKQVGPSMLNHTIIGVNDDICAVTLSTPDDRTMSCEFALDDLKGLTDQHFMVGILSDTTRDPSQDSVNADNKWTDLKAKSCSF